MAERHFTVNAVPVAARVEGRMHLADFLRERLLLTGTHLGCEHGVCGACTVLIDGAPARSCIAFTASCDGAVIQTIEGFGDDPVMAALREAFSAEHALQCGYCTPGMLVTAYDIVRRLPDADESRIREELAGNLCRCTGYAGIVAAIRRVLDARARTGAEGTVPARLAPMADAVCQVARAGAADRSSRPGASAGDTTAVPPSVRVGRGARVGMQRRLPVALDADDLWRMMREPDAVVRCLPGAEITAGTDSSELSLRFSVAVGPMRAVFEGPARVVYDQAGRSGRLTGRGTDRASRTRARGEVGFSVAPADPGRAWLALSISYELAGPLAQFGRAMVVEAVADQLLERFSRNLEAQALGEPPIDADQPFSAGAMLLRGLWQRLCAWLEG